MIRRINFFGGPGVGKSTLAARTFAWLKQQSVHAEHVNEWIKIWAHQNHVPAGFDDFYAFAKQLRREDVLLQAGVDVIVTDSPLYLQCVYANHRKTPARIAQHTVADIFEERYPSLNFLVLRNTVYDPAGRYESIEEAKQIDIEIELFLHKNMIFAHTANPNNMEYVQGCLTRRVLRA